MIKVHKTKGSSPRSLRIPEKQGSSPGQTTHQRRLEVIEMHINGLPFPKSDLKYTSRYKQADTKRALQTLYQKKCAYCEQKEEQLEVEHYRPTSVYPWLAYSWDNLILSCTTCNKSKKGLFTISGKKAQYDPMDLNTIHELAKGYAALEQPCLLHPELDECQDLFSFDREGGISGMDDRAKDTCKLCNLNRDYLRDKRKKVLDDFRVNLESLLAMGGDSRAIKLVTHRFEKDLKEISNEFLAFRRFALKALICQIVDEVWNQHDDLASPDFPEPQTKRRQPHVGGQSNLDSLDHLIGHLKGSQEVRKPGIRAATYKIRDRQS